MPFTIPNAADASHSSQSQPDKVDMDILVAGYSGTGVISGCAVTAQGSPDMTVAVAAGVVSYQRVSAVVASGNVTITAADGTNPRFDLIVVSSAGAKSAVAGTPAASPVFPAIPVSSIVLAAVHVPATDTTISSGQIIDKRVVLTADMALGSVGDVLKVNAGGTAAEWGDPTTLSGEIVLSYVERTTPLSVTATTEATAQTIVTAGAVSLDGTTDILVEFFSPNVKPQSTAGSYIAVHLYDGSTAIGWWGYSYTAGSNNGSSPMRLARILTPSAGSHTYSARVHVGTTTGTVAGGAGGSAADMPAFIRVTRSGGGVATAADAVALFTGTPDGTKFLKDDGTLATPGDGSGGKLYLYNNYI